MRDMSASPDASEEAATRIPSGDGRRRTPVGSTHDLEGDLGSTATDGAMAVGAVSAILKSDGGTTDQKPLLSAPTVASIGDGERDALGSKIVRVYFKRDAYAIYESRDQVHIQYADDSRTASDQIVRVARLLPLRDRLNYLIVGAHLPNCYREQVAEALRLGLEGQPEIARSTLEAALSDARERMARRGRIDYLRYAGLVAMLVSVILGAIAVVFFSWSPSASGAPTTTTYPVTLLLLATAAGAIGALFSIALSIRARTVVVDADWQTNAHDGAIRVGIGAIAGAVLFLFLSSGIITEISAGTAKLTGTQPIWQMATIVGFAAGFLERLVPDILEKGAPTSDETHRGGTSGEGSAKAGVGERLHGQG